MRAKKKRGKGQHRRHAVGKHDPDKRQWRGYREDRSNRVYLEKAYKSLFKPNR